MSDYHCDEMEECTDGYVAYAMEQVELAGQECKDPVVLIEQRLDYTAYVPEGFGTGDLLIVADHILTVIDFKYGKGVAVEYLKLAQMEFREPPLLSDEEIAEVLKVADELAKWSADIYAYAQDEAVTKGKSGMALS